MQILTKDFVEFIDSNGQVAAPKTQSMSKPSRANFGVNSHQQHVFAAQAPFCLQQNRTVP